MKFIPVNEPQLNGNEKKYLQECIETGWISSEGPFVSKLEEQFATAVGRQYGVAVSSGTAALDISVAALQLGPGDEVILPTFTIISCINQVVRCGAVPVLVDSDPYTWNMDIDQVREKITEKTKAIIAVHTYGLPVDMNPLLEIAQEFDVSVIEDAAQMHGQRYLGIPCGHFGVLSTFSFYPNKHITTGEGGIVVTDNQELAERCGMLRNLCFKPEQRFVHDELGWNYRISNVQAALGVAQLERLDEFVRHKREIGRIYSELLADVEWLQQPVEKTEYAENIYWVYGLVLHDSVDFDANEAMNRLKEKGVGSRPFFWPMHEQPVFKKMNLFKGESYPNAERLARRGFYIPSGLKLNPDQQFYVAKALRGIIND